jgi:predicted alpha/beta hydrolase family esterase
VLASHSLGCCLVAYWAVRYGGGVRGAFLVAPTDVEQPSYPIDPGPFSPMPRVRLPFPSIVVASANDEYISLARAQEFASAWGSRLVNIGDAGHINGASGYGPWPEGLAMLESFALSLD